MSLKRALYQELVPEARATGISVTNWIIIGLVLLSFLALALETEPTLSSQPNWAAGFSVFNVVVVSVFALEYVLRVWVSGLDPKFSGVRGRLKYMTQFCSPSCPN